MQKARNDAIEAHQQNRTVKLSSSLDKVSSSILSNAFKPMHTTASLATVATTSSGPNLDPDRISPVAVTSMSKPPVQPPIRRTFFLRRKLYQTTITWGDRDSFVDYMHVVIRISPWCLSSHWIRSSIHGMKSYCWISARYESTARITWSCGSEQCKRHRYFSHTVS